MKGFSISTDKSKLQRERVHRFLSKEAYWCTEIPMDVVNAAIDHSLCFGLYSEADGAQIGFARVVTDYATFAWICDVYVENEFRDRGLATWLIESVMKHSALQGLRRICLTTKDAHGLYSKHGFEVTKTPASWMEIKDPEIYKRR